MNSQGGVVLNWEATGNAGPSVLFETSADNAELIKKFGTAAALPIGDSHWLRFTKLATRTPISPCSVKRAISGSTSR